jgi:deoxyribonuclease IV
VLVGSHVPAKDPIAAAAAVGSDAVQLHLSAPVQWRAPKQRADAEQLRAAGIVACVHAPYLCNPASGDPVVRERTAVVLQQTLDEAQRCGAGGVIVHAGHAAGGGSLADALQRWVEVASRLRSAVPLLIENTASGTAAPGRLLTDAARLFAVLRGTALDVSIGACLDTCHAWAGDATAAADPAGWVRAFAEAAGGIQIIHVNDSKDAPGAGRDRHENLGEGEMGLPVLQGMLHAAVEAGASTAIVETPGGPDAHARDIATVRRLLDG